MLSAMPPPISHEYRIPAAHLVAALEASGVSQSELARRLNVTQGTVNRWARNKAPISISRWIAILSACGLPAAWAPPAEA